MVGEVHRKVSGGREGGDRMGAWYSIANVP